MLAFPPSSSSVSPHRPDPGVSTAPCSLCQRNINKQQAAPEISLWLVSVGGGAVQTLEFVEHPEVKPPPSRICIFNLWKGRLSACEISPAFPQFLPSFIISSEDLWEEAFLAPLSQSSVTAVQGAIILHKCFSSLLEKLPLWLYHNILLLWCNFHRSGGGVWTSYVSVIRCSYGLLEFEIGFYLPSKSGNTIKLSSLTLNAILLWSVFVPNVYS